MTRKIWDFNLLKGLDRGLKLETMLILTTRIKAYGLTFNSKFAIMLFSRNSEKNKINKSQKSIWYHLKPIYLLNDL